MSSIIKEYLLLIIGAAIAVIVLIWYLKKQGTAAITAATDTAKAVFKTESEAASTIATAAASPLDTVSDVTNYLFKTTKYISPADQKAALAKINAQMFKK